MTITPLRSERVVAGWPDSVLASPSATPQPVTLVTECGHSMVVDVARWHSPASDADLSVIERCHGPVLDVGSGPGRIVRALGAQGIPGLGIDLSRAAVEHASAAGVACVVADVFSTVPGAGTWKTGLLLDGNIGIGGDPLRLLHRVHALLAPGGCLVVETAAPGRPLHRYEARVERDGEASPWFPWAQVGVQALVPLALDAGFGIGPIIEDDGRWFVELIAEPRP